MLDLRALGQECRRVAVRSGEIVMRAQLIEVSEKLHGEGARLQHERNVYETAIQEALVAAGVCRPGENPQGPHLLMALSELADAYAQMVKDAHERRKQ